MKVEGRFTGGFKEEVTLDEAVPKLTRATVENVYEGPMAGTGRLEYLFMHGEKQVLFMGLERIAATIEGKQGSFVLDHEGMYGKDTGVQGKVQVVPESGTGDFKGITGQGEITANFSDHQGTYSLVLYFG